MHRTPDSFPSNLIAVVLGTLLFVMSVAFVSIPLSLGGHPGEAMALAATTGFHPT